MIDDVEVVVSFGDLKRIEDRTKHLDNRVKGLRQELSRRDERIELLENLLGESTEVSINEDQVRCCWELVVKMKVADGFRPRLREQVGLLESVLRHAVGKAVSRLIEGRRDEPLVPMAEGSPRLII